MCSLIVTQRSRLETFETCPRKGYYGYLYNGRGISRKGFDPDLLIGLAVHAGIEKLLKGGHEDDAASIATSVFLSNLALAGMAPMVTETEAGFELVPITSAHADFMVHLVEALVRGFARVRLPKILEQYIIHDIESEEYYQLTPKLVFLSRCDFIAQRKSDGEMFIFNLKTVKWPDGAWRKKFHYDQQTLSELLGPEARYGRKFGGVIIEGLVKGTKNIEYPKGSGFRYNNSPLAWAWVGPDNFPFPADVQIKYEYTDASGRNRRLGPTYSRVPAHTVMPIRDWIDKIQREAPDVLEAQFVTLPPVLRNDFEVESWKRSTIWKEKAISNHLEVVGSPDKTRHNEFMDEEFPKHTANGNCLGFGQSTCPFFSICWEGVSPDDPDLYMPRPLNHPKEEEYGKPQGG